METKNNLGDGFFVRTESTGLDRKLSIDTREGEEVLCPCDGHLNTVHGCLMNCLALLTSEQLVGLPDGVDAKVMKPHSLRGQVQPLREHGESLLSAKARCARDGLATIARMAGRREN